MNYSTIQLRTSRLVAAALLVVVATSGCAMNQRPGIVGSLFSDPSEIPADDSLPAPTISQSVEDSRKLSSTAPQDAGKIVVRAQDPAPTSPPAMSPAADPYATTGGGPQLVPPGQPVYGATTTFTPQEYNSAVIPTVPGQYPNPGDPNALNPLVQPYPPSGLGRNFPENYADIDVYAQEAQTGRIMIGGAYNSDNGLTGQITIDERNFDIMRFPRSWRDVAEGRAFRGAGQGFRMELLPGRDVQRYLVSFTEPYLFNSAVSFSASGYFFNRNFFDWDEQRLGGQFSFGYRLTPELSVSAGTRLESVDIYDPRLPTSPELNAALGNSGLYLGFVRLINDTRDHPFLPTEGAYLEMAYTQAFGDYDYSRGDVEYRRYFLVYQRDDGSGRHTLSTGSRLGFTGSDTPVFENYFAGGFSTMRGFDFRGASPLEGGVRVGGEFQWLNSVEYTFPLTADDMIRGVLFCDYGTVEREITLSAENFRVAPGFGFRVHMPAAGMGGAPLAFDFAFPVATADGDDRQMFSFYMGISR